VTTVSHVVNESRPVREEVRRRVLDALEALAYRRNDLARSLRKKRSSTIGLILPDVTNPFFAEIARSIADAAESEGYSVIVCNSDGRQNREDSFLGMLAEKRADGVILIEAGALRGNAPDLDGRGDLPMVTVDRFLSSANVDSVGIDNALGGRRAARHLLDLGHRHLACIAGPSHTTPSGERVTGFQEALLEQGVLLPEERIHRGTFQPQSGYDITLRLLREDPRITAIFACNDLMAFGAIRAATDLGKRVPDDLSVLGFDDIQLASFFNPPLTTVAQPRQEMGARAVQLLLERMTNPELSPRHLILETHLVLRSSTAPPP
jgi:LacI family transcriptional regulator